MKIQENIIEGKKVIHIYLRKKEFDDINVQKQIKEIKDNKNRIVLFVSGDKELNKTLKEMVEVMSKKI